MNISLAGQLAEIERELAVRRSTYPARVGRGDLRKAEADLMMQRMDAVRQTLMWLHRHEDVVRAAVGNQKEDV